MSKTNSTRPREIERHIIRTVRKLADSDLIRLLEALRTLTRSTAPAQEIQP